MLVFTDSHFSTVDECFLKNIHQKQRKKNSVQNSVKVLLSSVHCFSFFVSRYFEYEYNNNNNNS